MLVSRRSLLRSSGLSLGLGLSPAVLAQSKARFSHGVASGDPLADRVILWTRVEPNGRDDVDVRWVVALDADFQRVVASGRTITDAGRDYTVKVDADGLEPDTSYYYRFNVGAEESPIGRTKTLPESGLEQLKLAVVSCSNISWGYFNVYGAIASRSDIDFVLHLGDYIYESERGFYASTEMEKAGRAVQPAHETVSLADYRMRYAQYRRDPDLQAVHAAHPMIAVWDDHEFTNDAWQDGAQNHNADEGDWNARKAVAMKVYYEWMPVRPTDPGPDARLFRSFDIGGLASLIMLDSRVYGRDRQLDLGRDVPRRAVPIDMRQNPPKPITDPAVLKSIDANDPPEGIVFPPDWAQFREKVLAAPERTVLGWEQEAWLQEQLKRSKANGVPWQVLGQQTLLGNLVPVDMGPLLDPGRPGLATAEQLAGMSMMSENDVPAFMDMFGGGYPAARSRLLEDVSNHAENVLVLAGDSHNSWAFNLADSDGRVRAVEMGAPSVSSPGFELYINADPIALARAVMERNEELVFAETENRGYVEVTVTPDSAVGTWHYVSTVLSRDFDTRVGHRMRAEADGAGSVRPLALA